MVATGIMAVAGTTAMSVGMAAGIATARVIGVTDLWIGKPPELPGGSGQIALLVQA
jgi:hypothetical protein